MKILLLFISFTASVLLPAQSKVQVDIASPKPSILIDGVNCVIGNTIYSCTPKTCNAMTITEGDSILFCTNNEIYLNTDSAYWMQWNFTGSNNFPSAVTNSFPSNTPICYYPIWTVAGNYTVDIFYNGWLSAYPTSDCWTFGPSHWILSVTVLSNTGITSAENNLTCEVFPNPGNGIFQLEIPKPETIKEMYVTDIFGKEIFIANDKTQIDLTNYAPGIYLLNLITENGRIIKKIIKQNN
jgi:hypothetical protein